MTDEADFAQARIEQELERAISAARGLVEPQPERMYCSDCEEPLEPHRRRYGRCIECQEALEWRQQQRGR